MVRGAPESDWSLEPHPVLPPLPLRAHLVHVEEVACRWAGRTCLPSHLRTNLREQQALVRRRVRARACRVAAEDRRGRAARPRLRVRAGGGGKREADGS